MEEIMKYEEQQIRKYMVEMIKLCKEVGIIATNDTVKVKDTLYYTSFKFRPITDKECPRCKGEGKVPL